MSKKYSSYSKHGKIFENWRRFLKEEESSSPAETDQASSPAETDQASSPAIPEEEMQAAAKWVADEIAPLIAQADAGNYTKPLAELVKKLNSAEGLSPAVREILKDGTTDGQPSDETVSVKMGTQISASKLKPTQGVIDLFKSAGYNGSVGPALKSVLDGVSGAPPILAAGNGGQYFIIDGHHRWSGAVVFNPNVKIPANVIIMDPGKALLVSQLSIAAYLGADKKLPSATVKKGRSIIGPSAMSREAIVEQLTANVGKVVDKKTGRPFMNGGVLKVVGGYRYGYDESNPAHKKAFGGMKDMRAQEEPEAEEAMQEDSRHGRRKMTLAKAAINKIADNCDLLAKKFSNDGPPRTVMPQFDPDKGGPKFDAVKNDFASGELNFKTPTIPGQSSAK